MLQKLACLMNKESFFAWYNQRKTPVWLCWNGNLKAILQKKEVK